MAATTPRAALEAVAGQTHVVEDLFVVSADDVALVGSRCQECGSHYFPQALGCRNPDCDGTVVERVLLGRRGRLYSYTIQQYQPPPLFRMAPWKPYAIGLVEVGEGLKVIAMLTDMDLDDLRIGTAVRLVAESLYEDGAGRAVLTYKYAPSDGGTL